MKILKNILAIALGWIAGGAINMTLVEVGSSIFPIEGIDMQDLEAYSSIAPDLEPQYFLFPFLAHALGTFVGALIAYLIAANQKMKFAIAIGFLFLIGGIFVNIMITGPLWFTVVDLVFAYFPMAYLGGRIASLVQRNKI